MQAPDSFATAEQAAGYGYVLPAATADGLLARATQAIRDAAGIPVTQATSTLELRADRGHLKIPSPVVTDVASVTLLNDDGTTETVTRDTTEPEGWHWDITDPEDIRLGAKVPGRHCGRFSVVFTHGFAEIPPGLVDLTGLVALRLSVTPAALIAGIRSQTVGSVSWTADGQTSAAELTETEICRLGRIIPVRRAWQVPV